MTPLTVAELDAALVAIGGFEPQPFVAVAVSGGSDSLALTLLADRWASRRGGRIVGLIVDHRLRPESAVEVSMVAGWLAGRGIAHAVLVWDGDKPAAGIQEAARTARYRLLAGWCMAQGCLHLLTAHHREDQAETYLIRRRAGSGVDGLAGMATVRELRGMRLVRPLLGIAKARLAAALDCEGQKYLTDPSNRNPIFERSRLRMQPGLPFSPGMATAGSSPATTEIISQVCANATRRIARERALGALLARAAALYPAGFALLDPEPIVAAGVLGEQALGRVARTIGAAAYPIRRAQLARLRTSLGNTPLRASTLAGCRFVPWRGRVLVLREVTRAALPLALSPGMPALWDRRFVAMTAAPASLCYLGAEGVRDLGRDAPGDDNPLPRLIYPALPAFRDPAGQLTVLHLDSALTTSAAAGALSFRPATALLDAWFAVV